MLFINRLTEPGGIKRVELRTDAVKVVLRDGTSKVYTNNNQLRRAEPTDCGCPATVADNKSKEN